MAYNFFFFILQVLYFLQNCGTVGVGGWASTAEKWMASHPVPPSMLQPPKSYAHFIHTKKSTYTVVCEKIAAVHEKAHFWLFLVEISFRFGKL